MKCFRCDGLNFNRNKPNLFGLTILECDNCTQQFFVENKLELTQIELLGAFEDIVTECIVLNCQICNSTRYIAIDCTGLNMQACALCDAKTVTIGGKIPLHHFIENESSIKEAIKLSNISGNETPTK